jgi:hypothetical protein
MYGLTGSAHDQAAQRRGATLTDDWGREWSAVIDKKTGDPIGSITPKGWSAPWRPDQAYMRPDPDNARRLIIDLERALSDALEAHEEWNEAWVRTAAARNIDPNDDRNQGVLHQLVGAKPAAWQPIKAALDGNRWILGFTQKPDARLIPYLASKRNKVQSVLPTLESFADDDLETRLAIEEEHDPHATGGKKTPKGKKPQKLVPVPLGE